ncbi:MAG: hypothetical protein KatS3mg077_1328 [Candidatus Binatia bacterium]|nr:MAG: hypothetical protein KatS3mg077_1328 [Candidatus Binatia bacterium]
MSGLRRRNKIRSKGLWDRHSNHLGAHVPLDDRAWQGQNAPLSSTGVPGVRASLVGRKTEREDDRKDPGLEYGDPSQLVEKGYTFPLSAIGDAGTILAPAVALIEVNLGDGLGTDLPPRTLIDIGEEAGGARAAAMGCGSVGSPRWARIPSIEERSVSVRKAISRISPVQLGQTSGKTS